MPVRVSEGLQFVPSGVAFAEALGKQQLDRLLPEPARAQCESCVDHRQCSIRRKLYLKYFVTFEKCESNQRKYFT
jgi:hypothetical protein